MKQRTYSSTSITDVRDLANQFDAAALTQCMEQALQDNSNPCYSAVVADEVINVLAKARFVKQLILQGMPIHEAMRELGKRMRALSGNVKLERRNCIVAN